MLALEYQRKEGTYLEFKVGENISFLYSFDFKVISREKSLVTIHHIIKGQEDRGDYFNFSQELPIQKNDFIKLIGGWVKKDIWAVLAKDVALDNLYGDNWVIPTKDKTVNKIKQYTYLRSKKISAVLGGIIWREWITKLGICEEEMKELSFIAFRLQPAGGRGNWAYGSLFNCMMKMKPELWTIVKSDMRKYNTSLGKHILKQIDSVSYNITHEQYIHIIKSTPDLIRKCRYGFTFDQYGIDLNAVQAPNTRWQWFAQQFTLGEIDRNHYLGDNTEPIIQSYLKKLTSSDISVWHYFKKAYHISKPYSLNQINHMSRVVFDGIRMYEEQRGNAYGVSFVPVEGSIMRMVRNAIYNHRQEEEMNKKRALEKQDYIMPLPPIQLPEWMEIARLKTAHDMIMAGMECRHCIGSYTYSNDVFLKDGNVCAQINRDTLEIQQCYDAGDQITKASESFRKKVNKALEPFRENLMVTK